MKCSYIRYIFFLSVLGLLAGCRQPTSPPLSIAAHTLQANDQMLNLAQTSGFDTIVQVFPWREIEPTRGQFHWERSDQIVAGAEFHGLDLIVRLDQHPTWVNDVDLSLNAPPDKLKDYGTYVQRVAERYQGRVRAYIIWNEPNLALEWGGHPPDPVAFTALLKVGHDAVRAGDPDALVVSAGLAPTNSDNAEAMDERHFLRAMYQAGAAIYFDVLAAHPYSFGQAPTITAQQSERPTFDRLRELREIMITHDDAAKPVWITEMGWTVAPPPGQADIVVSLNQQADYLVEALEMIRRDWPWVELVTVWNLSVPTVGDPFGGYSLLDMAGLPRPVYESWKNAIGSPVERGLTLAHVKAHNPINILAADTIIHVGDTDLQPPWWPLYGGRKPSLSWTGGFYLPESDSTEWDLILELMQQNEVGATVAINGVPLFPDLPQQDFTRRWLTVRRSVPSDLLQPGHNELTITTVRLLPDAQQDEFVWDDFQVRHIRLIHSN